MREVGPVAELPPTVTLRAANILAKTSSTIGPSYFSALSQALAQEFSVRWVFVGQFEPSEWDTASTLAFWDDGPAFNFSYDLANSPCADVRDNRACCFPDNIQQLFPQDHMLAEMGARSYAGAPLRAADGRVLGLIAMLNTEPLACSDTIIQVLELCSGRAAAELERIVTASLNERLGRMIEASISEAYVFDGRTYRFELVNKGARENLGYSMPELRKLTPWDLKPEFSKSEFLDYVDPLKAGQVPVLRFETVHLRKDGTTYPVAVELQYFPDAGSVFFASISDETERKKQEEREQLLLREVNHRAKNILAVVQVLARQSAKHEPEDFLNRLEARIAALAASHDVLVNHAWQEVPLEELVRSQLGHFESLIGDRINLAGPSLTMLSSAAQSFGMTLHELATNAAKYGALANEKGTVTISWELTVNEQGERVLNLRWEELGGPEVTAPDRPGFGSMLIERSLAQQFGCKFQLDYRPEGLACRFSVPSKLVLAL